MGKRDKRKKAASSKNPPKSHPNQTKFSARRRVDNDDEEDIDAILAAFKKVEEARFQVTEEKSTPLPSRRHACQLVANPLVSAELILFGGEFFDGQKVSMFNEIYKYNIDKKEWRRVSSPNAPAPRSGHQLVATHSKLFLFGGEFVSPNQSTFYHYKDMWTFDLATNQWEKLEMKNMPSARSGHRMVTWKHYLVLYGGFYDTYKETRYFDDLHLFDTTTYTWHRKDFSPIDIRPSARSGFQFFTNGTDIVLYGGYCKTLVKANKTRGTVFNDTWTLKMSTEPSLIKWERRKKPQSLPSPPRSGFTAVMYKNKAFFFGGVSDDESDESIDSVCHDDLFVYTVDGNKWHPASIRQASDGRKSKAANKYGIHVASSEPDLVTEEHEYTASPIFPNAFPTQSAPLTQVDSLTPSKPSPRFSTMLAVAQNRMYLFGGIYEIGDKEFTLNDLWSINLDKLDGWECIMTDDTAQSAWKGDDNDDDDDDDDDQGDSESSEEDQESDHDESKKELLETHNTSQEVFPLTPQELEQRAEQEENDPKPEEPLGKYWERTTLYWQKLVHEEGRLHGPLGKALRRDAFEVARERFNDMQPQLVVLKQQVDEAAEIISQRKKAADVTTERMSSRSRR
ncbi:hypothetical protein SeMB42_g05316 [Synchytrium endobioticum]|uniref:DUF4110 domain-containing protein n=1 Tax=Synchytrium endobioticum TaxID=286115 RepID=A0A507CSC4_9FUNG|nr:hypothetical protein SeMB42_g05316 [Synchytrium endobioticum]